MDELTHNQQQAPGSPRIYADTPHGIPLPQQDSCEVDSLPDDMGAFLVKPNHVSSPVIRFGCRRLGV